MKFYFLDILPLCEFKELEADHWLPCEMAINEFTLASGICRTTHHFIHPGIINLIINLIAVTVPGPIPLGYRFQAQSQSERTHEMPVEGLESAERDYREVLRIIHDFIIGEDGMTRSTRSLVFVKV